VRIVGILKFRGRAEIKRLHALAISRNGGQIKNRPHKKGFSETLKECENPLPEQRQRFHPGKKVGGRLGGHKFQKVRSWGRDADVFEKGGVGLSDFLPKGRSKPGKIRPCVGSPKIRRKKRGRTAGRCP